MSSYISFQQKLHCSYFGVLLNTLLKCSNCQLCDKSLFVKYASDFLSLQNFGRPKASNVSFKAVQARPDALLAKSVVMTYWCFTVSLQFFFKPSGRVDVEGKLAESEGNLDKVIKEYGQ